MNTLHAGSCKELRQRFEGREAIYVEKGALRVRVTNIRSQGGFHIQADVEEIITPGLGVGLFHGMRQPGADPLRWSIGAGYLTTCSAQSWEMGYGGWTLFFAPEVVQAVVECVAQLDPAADPHDGYRAVGRLRYGSHARETSQSLFPEAVDPASGKFRRSDYPPVDVAGSSGWIACPYCGRRFKLSDPRRWDGKRHTTCGQRLNIAAGS